MPKGKTSRPYNRAQKSEVKRNKDVAKRAADKGWSDAFTNTSGPGRKSESSGAMAQKRRELGAALDRAEIAKKAGGGLMRSAAPKTSKIPPKRSAAPKVSKVPPKRPNWSNSDVEADDQIHVKKSTVKRAGGGIMRGVGAAKKGTRYTRSC